MIPAPLMQLALKYGLSTLGVPPQLSGILPRMGGGGNIDEEAFNLWFKRNTPEGKQGMKPDDPGLDYNYRDYYSDMVAGKAPADTDENGHWPDTYKLPNHPSFSVESRYYKNQNLTPDAISWNGKGFKKMEMGGPVYEAEGEEVVEGGNPKVLGGQGELQKLSGNAALIEGAGHENGGVMMQGGERIFSDRLEFEGKSFAKHAEEINRKIALFEKKSGTQIALDTKKQMVQRLQGRLDELFMIQENMKQAQLKKEMPAALEEMAYGGLLQPKKYFHGGDLPGGGQNEWEMGVGNLDPGFHPGFDPNYMVKTSKDVTDASQPFNPYATPSYNSPVAEVLPEQNSVQLVPMGDLSRNGGAAIPANRNAVFNGLRPDQRPSMSDSSMKALAAERAAASGANSDRAAAESAAFDKDGNRITNPSSSGNSGALPLDESSIARSLVDYAPTIYNLAQGLGGKKYYKRESNPYEEKFAENLEASKNFDIQPWLESNSASFNKYQQVSKDASGGNAGNYASNALAGLIEKYRADAGAHQTKSNYLAQASANAAAAYANFGEAERAQKEKSQISKLQSEATRRNFVGAGLTGASQISQFHQQEKNMMEQDLKRLQILKATAPTYWEFYASEDDKKRLAEYEMSLSTSESATE